MEHNGISRLLCRIFPASLSLPALLASPTILLPSYPAHAAGAPPQIKEQSVQGAAALRGNSTTADLDSLANSAEQVFNLALAGKVDRIGRKMDTLKKQAASLSYIQDQSNGILLPRLGNTIVDLEQAIAAKDRIDTMRFANRITLIAATVAVPLKPGIPTEVSLLDYNSRELRIWSEGNGTERLSNIVMRMHLSWQTLMPKLIERDGVRELRRFSDIMRRLESARMPEEYGQVSRQVPPEIDAIRALFIKSVK